MTNEAMRTRSFNIELLDRFYGIFLLTCVAFLVIGVPFIFVRKTAVAAIVLFLITAVLAAKHLSRKGYPEKSLVYFSVGFWIALVILLYCGVPPVIASGALAVSVILAVIVNAKAGALFGGSYLFVWLVYIVLQTYDMVPIPYFTGAKFSGWLFGAAATLIVLLPVPGVIQQLRRSTSLQRAIIESTADGILVVDRQGQVQTYNQRFIDLWRIPRELLRLKNDAKLLEWSTNQVIDPVQFISRINYLYSRPDQNSFDTLSFTDGRTFERYSQPEILDGEIVGRVWSFRDVTQRDSSQQRLDMAIEISKVMLWELDMTNDQLSFNNDKLQVLGLNPKQVPKTLSELVYSIHPSDQGAFQESISAARNSKDGEFDNEFRVLTSRKSYQWIHSKGRIVRRTATGQAVQAIGTAMNITHTKTIEEDLGSNVQLLQSILDNVPVGLSAFDKQLNLIASNKLFQTNLGLPDSLFGGETTTFRDIIGFNAQRGEYGNGDPEQIVQSIIERAIHPSPHHIEHVRPNGVTLDIRGTPMPGGGFVTTYDDISDRKQAEMEVKRSEQLLRAAIDSVDEAFALYDADDKLALCNDKYRQLFATMTYTVELGSSFENMIRNGAQQGRYPQAIGRIEEWVHERTLAHRNCVAELDLRLSDGRVLRIHERKLPDGSTVGFRVDITDLINATQAAQEANIAKSRFLATMSHEIRTPMNGLLGMAQLLLTPNLSERERNDYARTILSSGQTLLTLLNDILDLSKIEAGKFQLDSIIFDPTSVISETQALFSGAAKSKNLQLDGNWQGPSGQRYQTDAHRLRQMLSNLVGNAIKFTPTGKVHLEATEIERNDAQALIEFSVTDSGIGIEADKLNLLFKPFSQTDSSTTRKYGGSGLGLSIVSHLARAMGGDVGVESQLGKGSRFWFRVKVLIVDIASESRQVQRSTVDTSYTDAQIIRGQVFVVEDNPVNRMVIDAMLSKLGTTQTFANDGQQALDAITSGARPDLILMDIHMPVMDGYAATQGIRQWETDNSKSRLPIIALTADAFEEDHQHCLAVGMDDFLSKPIVIESLKAALLQWLPKQAPISSTKATLDARELSPDECQQFSSLVSELIPLLTDNRFGSMTKLVEIQTLVKGSQLEADINDVDQILQSFRFDLALKRLRLVSVGATAIFT